MSPHPLYPYTMQGVNKFMSIWTPFPLAWYEKHHKMFCMKTSIENALIPQRNYRYILQCVFIKNIFSLLFQDHESMIVSKTAYHTSKMIPNYFETIFYLLGWGGGGGEVGQRVDFLRQNRFFFYFFKNFWNMESGDLNWVVFPSGGNGRFLFSNKCVCFLDT